LTAKLPTDLDGAGIDPRLITYAVELQTKALTEPWRQDLHLFRLRESDPGVG